MDDETKDAVWHARWVPFFVTLATIVLGFADEGTDWLLVFALVGVLVLGPWSAGYAVARVLGRGPRPAIGATLASLGLAAALIAALMLVLGLGLLLSAAIAVTMGAGAGARRTLSDTVRRGWETSRRHSGATLLTCMSWLTSIGAVSLIDSRADDVGGYFASGVVMALVVAVVVTACTAPWATAVAREFVREDDPAA